MLVSWQEVRTNTPTWQLKIIKSISFWGEPAPTSWEKNWKGWKGASRSKFQKGKIKVLAVQLSYPESFLKCQFIQIQQGRGVFKYLTSSVFDYTHTLLMGWWITELFPSLPCWEDQWGRTLLKSKGDLSHMPKMLLMQGGKSIPIPSCSPVLGSKSNLV